MSEEGAGTSERVLLGEDGAGDSKGLLECFAMKLSDLKIAVGHDDLTVPYAGGGKVFMAITELFPVRKQNTSAICTVPGECSGSRIFILVRIRGSRLF